MKSVYITVAKKQKKTNTILELLIELKEHIENDDLILTNGLCHEVYSLFNYEYQLILLAYLRKNDPSDVNSKSLFWWTKGLKKPRLEWLEGEIKKLKDV